VYDDGDWTLHLPDLDAMASDIAAEFRTHIPNQRPFLAALEAIGAPRGYYSVTAHPASASPRACGSRRGRYLLDEFRG
jgi:hypothetical protein